ncbi:MAG: DEAD/DEAH box helicase [Actinomycetia bacterium]|nr:DEAD/DEAH box helicase [Actinomycetes bacterium]
MDVADLALELVMGGRVAPGLALDDEGRARSWWWPLPDADDRRVVLSLLDDGSVEAQERLASELGEQTDRIARSMLVDDGVELLARRPGRRSVPEAWLRSLYVSDPYLSASLAPDRVAGLISDVERWFASGVVVGGSVQLCLRVLEPQPDPESDAESDENTNRWGIEPLVRDPVDVSLMVPLAELFEGTSLFGADAFEDALEALGLAVKVAPELQPLVARGTPEPISFTSEQLVEFVAGRHPLLSDLGIAVLLPSWWAKGRKLGIKVNASSGAPSSSGEAASGFGLDSLVSFQLQASLGGVVLTTGEIELLRRAATAKRRLVQMRGEWVEVNPEQLAAVLARVDETGEARASDVLRAALGLDDLDIDGVDIDEVEADGWIGDLLDDTISGSADPVEAPTGFDGVLRPYQQRGVGWLAFLGRLGLGACLADDMGLGKTAQLIGAVLHDDTTDGPTLVVSPVSVTGNWKREIERFAPDLAVVVHHGADRCRKVEDFEAMVARVDIVLTTYSLVHRDHELLDSVDWARVVLDEAQQIKNPGTKAARSIRALKCHRRVALTGTPVENHLGELWSIMQFLNPGLLGSMAEFRRRFARPIEVDHDPESTAMLSKITTPFVLRRLKSDKTIIDDLPPKIETVARCPLTKEQATLYQSVVDELLEAAAEADGIKRQGLVLAGITRLKQICNHPAHFLGDGSVLPGRSGKLDRVEELVEEMLSAGDKALVFTQFTAWGERLEQHLSRRFGVEALWLHGGVKRKGRDEMIDRFSDSDGPPLMLLSLKAGGTGLNLTAANHVIHYDRWWNPAVEDQATDRAYRIGQTRTVQVHKMVSAATVEEHIDGLINRKRDLAERVVGTGEKWLTQLDAAELADVIKLSAEPV